MRFFRRSKCETHEQTQQPKIIEEGYLIDPLTVISTDTHMIVRVAVRMPFSASENIKVVAKDECGCEIATECIFMGKNECTTKVAGALVYKEFVYSVYVPYPERDLIFSIQDLKTCEPVHEQKFEAGLFCDLRHKQDDVLYQFALNDPYYTIWFEKQKPTNYELDLQKKVKFAIEPKFSIVVPLYKTPLLLFKELILCIVAQTYANWELILVNASPECDELCSEVKKACEADARIKAIDLEENEGITLNTSRGIEVATGDFVCFVDHDDLIEANTLFEYAQAINNEPRAELLYCDEDKLYDDGRRGEVFFKPEFSLHLLRSNNYICHMLTIKRDLLLTLDYKDKRFDGAQDHHLTLQAIEKTRNVVHIPKVLYHWRVTKNSTSGGSDAKPYAQNATILTVSEHLKRVSVKAQVLPHPTIASTTQVNYALPENNPKVSIIIPTKDQVELLKSCLDSIFEKTTYENYEIVLIENNSEKQETFAYYETLKQFENVKVCKFEGEFNFSKIINFGRSQATGEYLLLLNNDTELITPNWIESMLGVCSQPEVGLVGAKLLFPDETIQHAGILIADLPYHFFHHLPNTAINYMNYANIQRELSAVTAACVMVDVEVFDSLGGFNENMQVDYNDVDFCLRARDAGKLVVYDPFVQLHHFESISRGYDSEPEKQARRVSEKGKIWERWSHVFANPDPYFTPNICQRWQAAYYSF